MKSPKTLREAIIYFADPERAFVHAVNLRWPDKRILCPRCGHDKHSFTKTRLLWYCKGCKKQFTVKVGTIFEDSPIGLDKWMTAVWMIVNAKNGVSSWELHRALGVTQKTAWFMLHRIRRAMASNSIVKLGGPGSEVEADETFIGGKARNMHKETKVRRGVAQGSKVHQAIVMGVLERGGNIRTQVISERSLPTMHKIVKENVKAGSALFTDEHRSYDGLSPEYQHEIIDHAVKYVDGRVHTNGMENFWSLLKRGLHGTYVSVEPFHLFRYLDEQVFRYNNRGTKTNPINDGQRFNMVMSNVAGKRLTYDELTGKLHQEAF
jgi:transposase-like protein